MKKFIAQQLETCTTCDREIQKGEWMWMTAYDDCVCSDCEEEWKNVKKSLIRKL